MFLIRQSKPEDAPSLVKLARTVYFINLPPYENLIHAKIEHSQRCFKKLFTSGQPQDTASDNAGSRKKSGKTTSKPSTKSTKSARSSDTAGVGGMARLETESDMFMFSILDAESGSVIGTSQIRTHMGGPGNPNWRLAVSEKKFYSESLRFGTTHTVARLDGDESGPCEIGGLILDQGFRGHKLRPGRLLSFIRFHLVGLFRQAFADTVLAEMMGPVTNDGDNPFWDAFGRKFIPVKFAEADRFCQHNRKFIEELLPKDEIYLTLLPLEVINLVGVVGRETLPARRMLETLGFKYRGFVDPFDGGPHLDCPTDKIPLVHWTSRATLAKATTPERCTDQAIVSVMTSEGDIRGTEAAVELTENGTVRLLPQTMQMLKVQNGQAVGVTPLKHFAREAQLGADAETKRTAEPKSKKVKRTKGSK